MAIVLVRHDIEDFAQWKPMFDAHRSARQAGGLWDLHVLRDTEKPNQLTLVFRADDLKQAKEFAESAELRDAMKGAGVVGQPEIRFLDEAD
jgi:hypothetical protein